MSFSEQAHAQAFVDVVVQRSGIQVEEAHAHGRFDAVCYDPHGQVKWVDTIDNFVTVVGKNLALDTYLAGSAYTANGPYLGLIAAVSYTYGPTNADTLQSHGGWVEAGGGNAPTYVPSRRTTASGWSAASGGSKALSSTLSFTFTGSGTVRGAFLVFGAGATSAIDNTVGTLYSAGLFSGGDKGVGDGDILNVSYTASL